MQTTSYRVLVRWGLRPAQLVCVRRVALLFLGRWRAIDDACITVLRYGYIRRIGCLFINLDEAQILAYFGNLPFLNEDLRDGAVVRTGDLNAGFVALHLTEWLEGADRRPRGYTPFNHLALRNTLTNIR
jgi:hypothetical protein